MATQGESLSSTPLDTQAPTLTPEPSNSTAGGPLYQNRIINEETPEIPQNTSEFIRDSLIY